MTKNELIDVVAKEAALSKKQADAAVSAALDAVADALANDDKVALFGFGSFEVKTRGEREGRNPATGEKITIAASKSIAFTAAKALKDKVNG